MVNIVGEAKIILENLVETFCDFKTEQEYGRTAFWRWIDTIKQYTYSIERVTKHTRHRNGYFVLQMGKWGYVYYDIFRIGTKRIILVFKYQFNKRNFYKWLRHETIDSPIISDIYSSVTNSGIDGIEIVKSDANTYNWRDTNTNQILCKKWYLQIGQFNSQGITYVQLKDDVFRFINSNFKYTDNNLYKCIGVTPKGNFYVQFQNGYYCLLNPNCTRKDNNLWQDVTQQNGVFKGFNGRVWNIAENRRISQIITETIRTYIRKECI